MLMYYIYRHIRLDKNEPFYIGKGTVLDKYNTHISQYYRAYNAHDRNIYWSNIVNSVGYKVDIIFECDDLELIKVKEKEFISLYGRKPNGGTLVNMTDGGDGSVNLDKETIKKIANFNRGKPRSEETKRKLSKAFKGRKNEKASLFFKGKPLSSSHKDKISIALKSFYDKKGRKEKTYIKYIKILHIESGKIYNNCRDASRNIFGVDTNALSNTLKKGKTTYKGQNFKII